MGRIDDDRDGQLKVEDVMKVTLNIYLYSLEYVLKNIFLQVIETIGKENVKLSDKQLNEIVDLLDKEEIIETEEKIEKALKKEKDERDAAKAKAEDFTETGDKFLMQDKAKELDDTAKVNEIFISIFPSIKLNLYILHCRPLKSRRLIRKLRKL